MFIIVFDLFQFPRAIVRDFVIFILAPVAASNLCSVPSSLGMSSARVKNIDRSSAYATIAVLVCSLPILIPLMFLSIVCIRGFRHKVYRVMLSGHPCRTDLFIGICRVLKPLTIISDVALSYKRIILCMNDPLNACACSFFL